MGHVAVHHESQEGRLAPLQVVHTGPVGDVSIAAKKDTCRGASAQRPSPRPVLPHLSLEGPPRLQPHQVQEVLQHALHCLGHLRQEQPLHHPVGVPGERDSLSTNPSTPPPSPALHTGPVRVAPSAQDSPQAPGSPTPAL